MAASYWKKNKFNFSAALIAATCLGMIGADLLFSVALRIYVEVFAAPALQSYWSGRLADFSFKPHLLILVKWTPVWALGYLLVYNVKRFAVGWLMLFGFTAHLANYYVFYFPRLQSASIELGVSPLTFLEALASAVWFVAPGCATAVIIFLFWKLFRLR